MHFRLRKLTQLFAKSSIPLCRMNENLIVNPTDNVIKLLKIQEHPIFYYPEPLTTTLINLGSSTNHQIFALVTERGSTTIRPGLSFTKFV